MWCVCVTFECFETTHEGKKGSLVDSFPLASQNLSCPLLLKSRTFKKSSGERRETNMLYNKSSFYTSK